MFLAFVLLAMRWPELSPSVGSAAVSSSGSVVAWTFDCFAVSAVVSVDDSAAAVWTFVLVVGFVAYLDWDWEHPCWE